MLFQRNFAVFLACRDVFIEVEFAPVISAVAIEVGTVSTVQVASSILDAVAITVLSAAWTVTRA